MALNVEIVVDGGVNGQEALSRFGRFETLHLALASSDRLVRIDIAMKRFANVQRESECNASRKVGAR
jgi:hypothetical protein